MPKQKVAFFDIDGTVFRSGLYRELFFELLNSGILPKQVENNYTEALNNWQNRRSKDSFYEFEEAFVNTYYKEISKLQYKTIEQAAQKIVAKHGEKTYIYTRDLIEKLRNQKYFLVAISGSQIELVKVFAEKLKLDHCVGAIYERDKNGYYTGKVRESHCRKDEIVHEIIEHFNLTLNDSIAVGDTEIDAVMLKIVDHPIAFNPDEKLFKIAKANNWKIVVERKNVIYELEPSNEKYLLK